MSGDVDELSDPKFSEFQRGLVVARLSGVLHCCKSRHDALEGRRAVGDVGSEDVLAVDALYGTGKVYFFCVPYPTTTTSSRAVAV